MLGDRLAFYQLLTWSAESLSPAVIPVFVKIPIRKDSVSVPPNRSIPVKVKPLPFLRFRGYFQGFWQMVSSGNTYRRASGRATGIEFLRKGLTRDL